MPDRDRGKRTKTGLVLGIVVAALVSAIAIGWGLSESAEYQRQADYKTSEYAKHTGDKVAKTCVGIPPIEKFNCLSDATDAQRAYERDEYDLVAQRQSALWAYIMAAAAVIGMGLSVIGVFLVWTTFRETKRSADAAHDTLKETRRANEIAREIGVAQTSANVTIGGITHTAPLREGLATGNFLRITVQNSGGSDGRQLRAFCKIAFSDNKGGVLTLMMVTGAERRMISVREIAHIPVVVESREGSFEIPSDEDHFAEIECGGSIKIIYLDVFGTEFTEEVNFTGKARFQGIGTISILLDFDSVKRAEKHKDAA